MAGVAIEKALDTDKHFWAIILLITKIFAGPRTD